MKKDKELKRLDRLILNSAVSKLIEFIKYRDECTDKAEYKVWNKRVQELVKVVVEVTK